MLAIKKPTELPITAPEEPKPLSTRVIMRTVLIMDWHTTVTLLSSIFSKPMKAAVAALNNAPAKMSKEAVSIRGAMAGRRKISAAKNPDSRKERAVRAKPMEVSKINPETNIFLSSAVLFSALYCAVYFVMAESMPQSRNAWMRFGAIKAMP